MGNIDSQCLLGMACNDFTIIAADQTNAIGVLVLNDDAEKIHKISDHVVMGVVGDGGDAALLAQYIAKNVQLYRIRNTYSLSVDAVVHFTKQNLADSLKKGRPYMVNFLIGGYDEEKGGQLFYIDWLGSSFKMPYATHGLGGIVSRSILDQYHNPTLTEEEAYQVLTDCVQEMNKRLIAKLPNFQVSVVSKDGVRSMPAITTSYSKQSH